MFNKTANVPLILHLFCSKLPQPHRQGPNPQMDSPALLLPLRCLKENDGAIERNRNQSKYAKRIKSNRSSDRNPTFKQSSKSTLSACNLSDPSFIHNRVSELWSTEHVRSACAANVKENLRFRSSARLKVSLMRPRICLQLGSKRCSTGCITVFQQAGTNRGVKPTTGSAKIDCEKAVDVSYKTRN